MRWRGYNRDKDDTWEAAATMLNPVWEDYLKQIGEELRIVEGPPSPERKGKEKARVRSTQEVGHAWL